MPPGELASNDNNSNVAFLLLFIVYSLQLVFIQKKWRHPDSANLRIRTQGLWGYMAMSVIVPLLVSLLPELVTDTTPTGGHGAVIIIGSRFLIAYLVTIITLELALHAQAGNVGRQNPWQELLLTNLGFDIVSIVVFQILRPQWSNQLSRGDAGDHFILTVFFLMCAIPTIVTGMAVIAGSYLALTERANG